jgi:hypothetical protein
MANSRYGYATSSNSTDATWYTWTSGSTTTASDGNTVWGRWASADTSATTSNSATVWYEWSGRAYAVKQVVYQPAPETEEQKQARLARAAEQARAAEERRRQEAEALQRAEDLLMLQLSEKQRSDWKKHKAFDVISQSGKRFRIRNERSMNVDEYDADNKMVARHCIVPQTHVPAPDQYVMQKLMLEHQEADFMRIANHRVH